VNAIATGKGAAFGVDLRTEAWVELDNSGKIDVEIEGFQGESDELARRCVINTLDHFQAGGRGASVRTRSQIPISRGLKSSSAAANAIVLAAIEALGEELDELEAIKIGTRSAIEAKVSVTGAFDDACASLLGGMVLTDNAKNELIRRESMPAGMKVLIHVPPFQIRKQTLPLQRIRSLSQLIDIAFAEAMAGRYAEAMMLNSLCYSAALDLETDVMMDALEKGAFAAGLSGTGPATAILVKKEDAEKLRSALHGKDFIVADIYNGKDSRFKS
jgi:shikimate kinase